MKKIDFGFRASFITDSIRIWRCRASYIGDLRSVRRWKPNTAVSSSFVRIAEPRAREDCSETFMRVTDIVITRSMRRRSDKILIHQKEKKEKKKKKKILRMGGGRSVGHYFFFFFQKDIPSFKKVRKVHLSRQGLSLRSQAIRK